jgi:hypothetical protein
MSSPIPPSSTRSSGGLPYVSAMQAAALMRSGAAIATELIGNAFGPITKAVFDDLSSRWDFEPPVIMVRRLINDQLLELRGAFLQHLKQRQDDVLQDALTAPAYGGPQVVEEQMELMDANTMRTRTVAAKAGSRIMGKVEDQLRSLHVIVRFLTGKQQLSITFNPFTPDVFVQALLAAGEELGLNEEAWEFYLRAFEPPLAEEIARIHDALLDHFNRHGLDARVIRREVAARQAAERAAQAAQQASQQAAQQGGTGTGGGGGYGGSGYVDDSGFASTIPGGMAGPVTMPMNTLPGALSGIAAGPGAAGKGGMRFDAPRADANLVLGSLVSRLQADAHGLPMPALPRNSPPEPALLSAVNEFQQLGLQGLAGASLASSQTGAEAAWRGHLIEKSTRTVDKLTIELVGMLFDHVMQDQQVPDEIKALLSRLQFPVLKAALLDADFFAASAHPARRLIDRMASTAMGWEPYGDENERFRLEIERIVKEVLARFDKDLSVFEKLLQEFEAFIGDIGPRENDPVARAKRALEEAEKREILVINTTIQVRRAFEKVELEPYLRDFLVGPWVQVLVAATLRDSETAGFSKRFREAIHDLVWSVLPKANNEDRKRLTQLIPNLIRVLRDGMALTRVPEHEQQTFLRQLMESHAMAVKPVDQATYIKSSLVTSEVKARIDGLQITGTHPITTVAGGIRVSNEAVRRAAEEFDADVHLPEQVTDIGNLDRVEEAQMDEQIASWQRGTWFDLWDGGKMMRVRLRWISPLRTLFLFSANDEKDAHVLPPNVIKSYIKRGYIKPIEAMPLTRRAVDHVVGEFERRPNFAQELASRHNPA